MDGPPDYVHDYMLCSCMIAYLFVVAARLMVVGICHLGDMAVVVQVGSCDSCDGVNLLKCH